jgi:DNA-binding NtrC family response regulator
MPTVLVVENDAALAELFAFILSDEGYDVLNALNLLDALTILPHHRVDLIINDLIYGLYFDSLWDRVRQVREMAPHIPMIVCTGHRRAVEVPLEREGIAAILPKPFELDQLLELVRRFC